MKATELLQRQHREIEQLLEQLHGVGAAEHARIRREIADALVAHTVIEEEHFYPAVRLAAPDLVLQAVEEHGLATYELARALTARIADDAARARAAVLGEVILSHVRREESDLFRRAEDALTNQELAELAEVMEERFVEVRRRGYARVLAQKLEASMPRLPARTPARRAKPEKKHPATRRAAASARRAPARKKATTAKRAAPAPTNGRKATAKAKPSSSRAQHARHR